MIENEIEILRRIHHPNIVQLIEEFQTPKEIFLVMELVKVSTPVVYVTDLVLFCAWPGFFLICTFKFEHALTGLKCT